MDGLQAAKCYLKVVEIMIAYLLKETRAGPELDFSSEARMGL